MSFAVSAVALGAALGMAIGAGSARADQPNLIPAWYNGQIEHVIPGVSVKVVGVNNNGSAKHANPIYVVQPTDESSQLVDHVLGAGIPGVAGYNPWWDVVKVFVKDGRNLDTNPFTSEAEILQAAQNGDVELDDTGFYLLCQVIP